MHLTSRSDKPPLANRGKALSAGGVGSAADPHVVLAPHLPPPSEIGITRRWHRRATQHGRLQQGLSENGTEISLHPIQAFLCRWLVGTSQRSWAILRSWTGGGRRDTRWMGFGFFFSLDPSPHGPCPPPSLFTGSSHAYVDARPVSTRWRKLVFPFALPFFSQRTGHNVGLAMRERTGLDARRELVWWFWGCPRPRDAATAPTTTG